MIEVEFIWDSMSYVIFQRVKCIITLPWTGQSLCHIVTKLFAGSIIINCRSLRRDLGHWWQNGLCSYSLLYNACTSAGHSKRCVKQTRGNYLRETEWSRVQSWSFSYTASRAELPITRWYALFSIVSFHPPFRIAPCMYIFFFCSLVPVDFFYWPVVT